MGQEIQKIIVTGQYFDEPPTKQGTLQHKIELKRNGKGDLISHSYWIGNKKKKLNDKITIESDRLERVMHWIDSNKRTFRLEEIHLDYKALNEQVTNSEYKPHFTIKSDYLINLDSFNICQQYNFKRSNSTGGYSMTIVMTDKSDRFYIYGFDSDDIGLNNLKFFDYLICYELLHDKLPTNFSGREHFGKIKMITNTLFVITTTECENYYYKEFINNRPERTPQENRMKFDWDFVKYLEQRKKTER